MADEQLHADNKALITVLAGHSYIRRVHDAMDRSQQLRNLSVTEDVVNVRCSGLGGATALPGKKSDMFLPTLMTTTLTLFSYTLVRITSPT